MDGNLSQDPNDAPSAQRVILPPLCGLPVEVWGEIFRHCSPNAPFTKPSPSHSPLKISQICRAWRNIAISAPYLWAYLEVSVSDKTSIDLIAIWLSRSASFPLRLRSTWTGNVSRTVSAAFLTLFASHLYHWRYIEFHTGPNTLFLPDIPPEGAPMLENVFLVVDPHHENDIRWLSSVMHAAPRLKSVHWPMNNQLALPWAQLSYLGMSVSSIEHALDILVKTSQIIGCSFTFPHLLQWQESTDKPHISLPHLDRLAVDAFATDISLTMFFEHLTLPALTKFTGTGWFHSSFLSLLSRSSTCSLTSLHLSYTHISDALLLGCFKHPCVQSLSQLWLTSCGNAVTDRVLEFLTFRDECFHALPVLEIVYFSASVQSTDGILTDMIESRCGSKSLPAGVIPPKRIDVDGLNRGAHENDISRINALHIEGLRLSASY